MMTRSLKVIHPEQPITDCRLPLLKTRRIAETIANKYCCEVGSEANDLKYRALKITANKSLLKLFMKPIAFSTLNK